MARETACRSCGSAALEPILSLGDVPLANAILTREQLALPEARFPLDLVFCRECSLVQITETVPPEQLFSDYPYFSSFSDTMVSHARELVGREIQERRLDGGSLAAEVASNDGYLLQFYAKAGIPVLGIEPAANVAIAARERGVRTVCEFFGAQAGERLAKEYGRADIIHANNVLAHVADLNGVVQGFRRLIKDYQMLVDSHVLAIQEGREARIQAIDMGRRGLHNEGAELLIERLAGKITIDFPTARRLFTLVCVLHQRI